MTPRLITILTLMIGLGLFAYSLTLPYYKEPKADMSIANLNIMHKSEYAIKQNLRTNKLNFMDLGSGLSIVSTTILLFLILVGVKKFGDFKNVMAFDKKITVIYANVVWLILLPGTYWYYLFRLRRGDYAPLADSIAIPIFTQIFLYLILLIPLNLFIYFTTRNIHLPTRLLIKPVMYDRITILWEIFFGFWLLINLLCLISFVVDGDHFSIPVNLFFTFILLTLRAGQMDKFGQTEITVH